MTEVPVIMVRSGMPKFARKFVGVFLVLAVSLVGVGVGNSSPSTNCSIFGVWVQSAADGLTQKARNSK